MGNVIGSPLGTMVSDMMIKPTSSPVFQSPNDYGLEFEDVEFKASDGVKLSGWLLRSSSGSGNKVVIQSHFGVQCSRAGWTTQGKGMVKIAKNDVCFLNHAKALVENGYSVLMYDFRAHGNSEVNPENPWITWGKEEALDVVAAVNFVNSRAEFKGCSIGLLSICMGSSASAHAFAEQGLKDVPNIACMVAIQPHAYGPFVKAIGMGFVLDSSSKVCQKRTGVDFKNLQSADYAKDIRVPTLVVQNKNDPMADFDYVRRFHDELAGEKELLWLDLEKGRGEAYKYLTTYPPEIFCWFDKHM